MNKRLKVFIPFLLLAVFVLLACMIFWFKPSAERNFKPPQSKISVDVVKLQQQDFQVYLNSYGEVGALIQSKLQSQVSGKVIYISESLRSGGFFEKDELLLQIEDVDYQSEVDISYANLLDMEQKLAEQQALAEQAKLDWERLGQSGQPSDLVLRKPQLSAAKAQLASAKAKHKQALIQLNRTKILAPFSGRALDKYVDIGQVISTNTLISEIYASDAIEVELPIKNNELELMDLPEQYKGKSKTSEADVWIISEISNKEKWRARLVRTASTIDPVSRQLHVVARLNDPFGVKAEGRFPLKIGQYVRAEIQGKLLKDVIVIDNSAIYQGSYVYLYLDGVLKRQPVDILWQNKAKAVIKSGLTSDDYLVTTSLGQVSSGTLVNVQSKGDDTAKNLTSNNKAKPFDLDKALQRIPADKLAKLKQMAKDEGKSLEQVIKEQRRNRGHN
ncbi:efflux RND transporter periplasmic adaptor subunit [Catenovulum maritimum]|uniref:Hemolysin D n=1 Tax=Catenovulum maritimum TaxID=1513271 RepID=A0A0J8GUD4_9ALTE|nr:efflux RND transporter periplasmic adaptor subunit [Catenovulum maritimum]KMT66357.1 hypothetical protein XM47_03750 [Catenovulum maritimum]